MNEAGENRTLFPHWGEYRPGKNNQDGVKIDKIIGLSRKAVVYVVSPDKSLAWECDDDSCTESDLSISLAQNLIKQVRTVLPKRHHYLAYELIGASLYTALNLRSDGDKTDYFKEPISFIEIKLYEYVHLVYISSALLLAMLTVVGAVIYSLFLSKDTFYYLYLGGTFGVLGAIVSVLQRFKDVQIEKYSSAGYLALRGITRVILGFLFGMFFIIAQKSGLIASRIDSNTFLLCSFAFISGFSERFIPELMSQIQGKTDYTDHRKSGLGSEQENHLK